ncbi:MAG: helix-turn-helix domain-containing protein [Clostridia bacterium]|nr:helix-turn-helix domain-containing protein [Clostridia bacterium]
MSNRLFQGIVHQMRSCINRTIGVVDENSIVIACSELGRIGEVMGVEVMDVNHSADGLLRNAGFTFKTLSPAQYSEYIIFVEGTDEEASRYASILAISLCNIKEYYDEKYDKVNFLKNVILDNILPGDIYLRSRKLRFNADVQRAAILIRITSHNEVSAYEILQNLFPDKTKDFIINVNERDIVLIKEMPLNYDTSALEKLAQSIVDTLSGEFFTHSIVGIGTVVTEIKDLARSFKEAQISLEVGKVFDNEQQIVSYNSLGIGRLIYQLPTTLCESFLREVFKQGTIENLDQETLFTIKHFFDNNLNVSETSRKLFVHRNTLVYRLEKIKKITGLDLREFDHAIVFKIALMVRKYLDSKPVKY